MSSQVSWFLEEYIINVHVEAALRGYSVDEITRLVKDLMDSSTHWRRLHVLVDVSDMEVTHENAELLYTALTPLMFEQKTRWIVLYGANQEMQNIFKAIMYDMFVNPCVVLDGFDCALQFLHKKDPRLARTMQRQVAV